MDGIKPVCDDCHITAMTPLTCRIINMFFEAGGDGLTKQDILISLQLEAIPRHEWPLMFKLMNIIKREIQAAKQQPKSSHRINS